MRLIYRFVDANEWYHNSKFSIENQFLDAHSAHRAEHTLYKFFDKHLNLMSSLPL